MFDAELTREFKEFIENNGWDLVGIADPKLIDRKARPGRRPCDLFPSAQAVLILGYGMLDPIQRGWVHNGKSGKFYSFALLELDRRVHMIRRFLRIKGYNCYGGEAYGGGLFNTGIRFGEAGASAGLGYIGKNNCLVTPEYGPRINLTYLATDAPLETVCIDPLPERECGVCTACQKVCISGAILGDGFFHQRQCDAIVNNRSTQKYYNDMVSQDCDKCIRYCPKGRVKWKNEPFSAEEREEASVK